MTAQHHPEESLLLAYAAGRLDPATALVLATHISCCGACRAVTALGETIGGILLEEADPLALQDGALARVLARLGNPETAPAIAPSADGTPAPLRAFMGRDLAAVRWKQLGPRLGYVTLYRRGPLALRLLRGAPGSEVGRHTHSGTEMTVVLRGGFSDETGHYGPGDFQSASCELSHNPVADAGEDCINLSVTVGRLRFRSGLQNAVAALFGF